MVRPIMPPKKQRSREHVIADLSINFVERQALLCGYSVERIVHDYGIDLLLWTYTKDGEPEPGEILLQVKATDHFRLVQGGRFLSCRIERAHLRLWLAAVFPVILIVYDAQNDRAFWIYVQAALSGMHRFRAAQGSKRATLRLPTTQILDPTNVRRFAAFRDAVLEQIEGLEHRHD